MTMEMLTQLCNQHGMQIDGWANEAGKSRDLYIGVGHEYTSLQALRQDVLGVYKAKPFVNVKSVTNEQHPDFGKLMLEIQSFWCE